MGYENKKEPYVYVQTLSEIYKFTKPILQLARQDISSYNLAGNIIRSDEWPLPWILRDFRRIAYYNFTSKPREYDTDFLLVESKRIPEVEDKLKGKYFTDTLVMRDAQDFSKAYFSYEKFKDIFLGRHADFTGGKKPI